MTITVNVDDAKARLSSLLNRAEAGEDVIIARNGRPLARLTTLAAHRPDRTPGSLRGLVHVGSDIDDFSPTDDKDWYASGFA